MINLKYFLPDNILYYLLSSLHNMHVCNDNFYSSLYLKVVILAGIRNGKTAQLNITKADTDSYS